LLSFRAHWPQIVNVVVYNAVPQLTLRGGWPESLRYFLLHQTMVTPIQTMISVDAFTQEGFCAKGSRGL